LFASITLFKAKHIFICEPVIFENLIPTSPSVTERLVIPKDARLANSIFLATSKCSAKSSLLYKPAYCGFKWHERLFNEKSKI
jgi:hypothetical protein